MATRLTTSALGELRIDRLDTRACKAHMEFYHWQKALAGVESLHTNPGLSFEGEPQAEVGVCGTMSYILNVYFTTSNSDLYFNLLYIFFLFNVLFMLSITVR